MTRDIKIKIGAQDAASGVLKRVGRNVTGLGQTARRIVGDFARVGTAVSAAAVGAGIAMKKLVDDFAKAGDLIHKTSLRTKLSAEFLSELAFAAEQSGTTLDQMSQAIFRAFRRIGNAETLTGPAARAVKELGINAQELADLEPEKIFFELVDALDAVEDPLRRSQMGFELFGDNWRQISPLIEQGTVEIRRLMQEGKELGRSLTGEQAAAAAAYSDQMNRLKSVLIGVRNEIGANLAPAFTKLAEAITLAMQNSGVIIDGIRLKIIDLNIAILQMLDSAERMIPFYAGSTTPGAINILQGQRSGIIADILRGAVAEVGPSISGMFSDEPSGSPNALAFGEGIERIFKEAFAGDQVQRRFSPEVRATESRLMQRGPGADLAARQGKMVLDKMQKFEELLAGGGPGGGIPVRDVRPRREGNVFEMEKVG